MNEKVKNKTAGTKEWADSNVNFLYGCRNDCVYCYAKKMAYRFKRIITLDEWKNMKINRNAIDKNYKKRSGRIMFPTSHDLFPKHIPYIKQVLEKLLAAGNDILITTKPRLDVIKFICEDFSAYKKQIQFRFTITSISDTMLRQYEPNAPTFKERLSSLIHAFNSGFKTSISIEPFLDYDPIPLVCLLSDFVTESIWIGPMNHHATTNNIYTRENLLRIYNELKNNEIVRFKDAFIFRVRKS
ncbi:MAG: radical SAM protein [Candidatus Helarchaeota archaeon]